jgi:hypothetical protein
MPVFSIQYPLHSQVIDDYTKHTSNLRNELVDEQVNKTVNNISIYIYIRKKRSKMKRKI